MWFDRASEVLENTVSPISRWVHMAGAAVLAGMMLLTAADVSLRYLLNRPVMGAFEITEYLMVLTIASGFAYVAIKKGHISVDLLISIIKKRTQTVVGFIVTLLAFGLCGLMTWQVALRAVEMRVEGTASEVLRIPAYPFV